jgi:hypothetical protein
MFCAVSVRNCLFDNRGILDRAVWKSSACCIAATFFPPSPATSRPDWPCKRGCPIADAYRIGRFAKAGCAAVAALDPSDLRARRDNAVARSKIGAGRSTRGLHDVRGRTHKDWPRPAHQRPRSRRPDRTPCCRGSRVPLRTTVVPRSGFDRFSVSTLAANQSLTHQRAGRACA